MSSKANKQARDANKRPFHSLAALHPSIPSGCQISLNCTACTISCTCIHTRVKRLKAVHALDLAPPKESVTFRMYKVTTQSAMLFPSQFQAKAQFPSSVTTFLDRVRLNWVSMQPGLATLSHHLSNLMGPNFDSTIVEPNLDLALLNTHLCPEATVITSSPIQFFNAVAISPLQRRSNSFKVTAGINRDIFQLPISSTEFRISGIDYTVYTHLKLPFQAPLALELQLVLKTIDGLATFRGLSFFMIICNTLYTDTVTDVDVSLIAAALPLWDVSAKVIYAVDYGDPLAAFRLCVCGRLSDEEPSPLFSLKGKPTPEGVELGSRVDTNRNQDCFSIACIPTASIDFNTAGKCAKQPLPLAISSDKLITSADVVLHPHFPGIEGDTRGNCTAIRNTFLIPFQSSLEHHICIRPASLHEIISLYLSGAHLPPGFKVTAASKLPDLVTMLYGNCPWNTALSIATFISATLIPVVATKADCDIVRCHLNKPLPSKSAWAAAYANDKDTNYIIARLRAVKTPWVEAEIRKVHKGYWQQLRENKLVFKDDRLTLFSCTGSSHRFLSLIVVPADLRRVVFSAIHASGVGAHMGGWKTMVMLRIRFFWPHMRKTILEWVNMCAACIPARLQIKASSGLVHSWPITTPMAIVSVDIWSPGDIKNCYGQKALFNTMCDMCQRVICVAITATEASYLARMFMEHVLLKFGICIMVVCDDGNEFRGTFEKMCNKLNIKFHIVAKRNHKAVGVERFHKFLNKAQKISTEERGTSEPFVEIGMATAYAWNASPIDGTDIVRSVPAIGRELRYPLDVSLGPIPAIIDNPSASVVKYLRYLQRDIPFSRQLLAFLVEDRRLVHRERVNEKRHLVTYKPGDIVMARVAVQSNKSAGRVAKLVYQSRGPFIVVEPTGFSSYQVRRYGKPESALRKFMTEDLYMLPPAIMPCANSDTSDMRYINSDYAPIKHPFDDNFNIEAYNTNWYDDAPPSRAPDFIRDNVIPSVSAVRAIPLSDNYTWTDDTATWNDATLQEVPVKSATTPQAISSQLPSKLTNKPPQIPTDNSSVKTDRTVAPSATSSPPSSNFMNNMLLALRSSRDCLLFIQYTPVGTMRPRWFLVQIEVEDYTTVHVDNLYYCTFLNRHPSDAGKADNKARWWPEWREIVWNKDESFEYGKRVLLSPRAKPDAEKFSKFGTQISLQEDNTVLVGPFNFSAPIYPAKSSAKIDATYWNFLAQTCKKFSILPPVLSHSEKSNFACASRFRATLPSISEQNLCPSSSSLFYTALLFPKREGVPPSHLQKPASTHNKSLPR